jgi:hypothetical protein
MRLDLAAALRAAHPDVVGQLRNDCRDAVRFLDEYLSPTEPIRHIMSIAVTERASVSSVLVITDRRLVFVAPRPQAISLPLSKITKSQFTMNFFFLHGEGHEYSLGSSGISEAARADFLRRLHHAAAVAELAGL